MFQAKAAMFLYSVSPVHVGAGTALGAIDNPVQRERHTGHPVMAGSGLKGALRDEAERGTSAWDPGEVSLVFGPQAERANDDSRHAGALSVSDAQLVLFPVRSLRASYVYATCPTALERARRLLAIAGVEANWPVPAPTSEDHAVLGNDGLLVDGRLILETFAFQRTPGDASAAAKALAELALAGCPGSAHFQQKIARDLVVLPDTRFAYFVRNATVVEPHVRIDDETGTADEGGLFYTENVPPESLFVSLVMASKTRKKDGAQLTADDVVSRVRALDGRMVQFGGDATTGRGQMLVKLAAGGAR